MAKPATSTPAAIEYSPLGKIVATHISAAEYMTRLQAGGRYARALPDKDHNYHTPILPKLALHVSTLWQEKLPEPLAIGQVVQAMITNNA